MGGVEKLNKIVLREYFIKGMVSFLSILTIFMCLYILGSSFTESITISILYVIAIISSSRYSVRLSNNLLMNIGGALAPLIMAIAQTILLIPVIRLYEYVLLLALSTFIVYLSSKYIPGKGIGIPLILPIVAISALVCLYINLTDLSILYSIPIAYTIAVYSTLIGADTLKALELVKKNVKLEIGGERLLDLIILSSSIAPPITAALLIIGNQ